MRADFVDWLNIQPYAENTKSTQLYRVKRVEDAYGNLDDHFRNGTYQQIIDDLQYSAKDERENKPNLSKIKFDGNIKSNLGDYKNAAAGYLRFLNDRDFFAARDEAPHEAQDVSMDEEFSMEKQQRLSMEKDLQAALRRNIRSLGPNLKIIDDGAERSVKTGFIDITCEDDEGIVVVELKAGVADSRSFGQILGYMGDLMVEEKGKKIKGILVAHDFDKRCKSAARAIPRLVLKWYAVNFSFLPVE